MYHFSLITLFPGHFSLLSLLSPPPLSIYLYIFISFFISLTVLNVTLRLSINHLSSLFLFRSSSSSPSFFLALFYISFNLISIPFSSLCSHHHHLSLSLSLSLSISLSLYLSLSLSLSLSLFSSLHCSVLIISQSFFLLFSSLIYPFHLSPSFPSSSYLCSLHVSLYSISLTSLPFSQSLSFSPHLSFSLSISFPLSMSHTQGSML